MSPFYEGPYLCVREYPRQREPVPPDAPYARTLIVLNIEQGPPIATMHAASYDTAKRDQTGKLFAASLDLFAAAEKALTFLAEVQPREPGADEPMRLLREAIEKATEPPK